MNDFVEKLEVLDQKLFLLLNSIHHPLMDVIMLWISNKYVWIPFYAILLAFIIWKFKTQSLYIIIAVAIMITASDQFTSGFMKPFFERLRPCYETDLQEMVHLVKDCGGRFGFASSHAANSFALAMFTWLLFRKYYPRMILMFAWAALVAYSRIYVGVHYPLDIIIGGLVGVLIALLIFQLLQIVLLKNRIC